MKVFRDNTASSVPVTFLYGGEYHTVVIGPASSNTVAKCVAAIPTHWPPISMRRPANAASRRSSDAATRRPALISEAPGGGSVWVYPRPIELGKCEQNLRNIRPDNRLCLSVEELRNRTGAEAALSEHILFLTGRLAEKNAAPRCLRRCNGAVLLIPWLALSLQVARD
jgi:hypothetical protein